MQAESITGLILFYGHVGYSISSSHVSLCMFIPWHTNAINTGSLYIPFTLSGDITVHFDESFENDPRPLTCESLQEKKLEKNLWEWKANIWVYWSHDTSSRKSLTRMISLLVSFDLKIISFKFLILKGISDEIRQYVVILHSRYEVD